ncbi:MAG: DnaA/Hda family protein [Pseudomonadota bacterium]
MIECDRNEYGEGFSVFCKTLQRQFGNKVYQSWMADLAISETSDDAVTLTTTSPVIADRLNQQYRQSMLRIWNACVSPLKTLNIKTRARLSESAASAHAKQFGTKEFEASSLARAQASARGIETRAATRGSATGTNGVFDFDAQGLGDQGLGAQGLGAQGFGAQGFGAQGFGARSAAHHAGASFDQADLNPADLGTDRTGPNNGRSGGLQPLSVIDGGRIGSRVDPRMRVGEFAVDDTNNMAFTAIEHIIEGGGAGEIVYLQGPSGCGKTHLMNGIANALLQETPAYPLAYYLYADFRNESVAAARGGKLQDFHERLATRDVVMIDDIHRLMTSQRTQEEALNLIDAFRSAGKRVLIAGLTDPASMRDEGLNPRLADRLAGGIPAMIAPAGLDLMVDILRSKRAAASSICVVSDEVLVFIAKSFRRSIREAIGALKQIVLIYGKEPREITISDVRSALAQKLQAAGCDKVGLDELLAATAETFDLTVADLTGRAQPQRIAKARHAFAMVGREVLNESFPKLGSALKRDHTTVMSSYDRAQALHERCSVFQAKVLGIREKLGH